MLLISDIPVLSHMVHALKVRSSFNAVDASEPVMLTSSPPFPSLSLVPITESNPSCLDSSMRGMWMPTSPSNAKVWSCRLVSYTITSPQSIMFGRHLLVSSSPSIKLGTVTSVGL
jgi:hypothetical protein